MDMYLNELEEPFILYYTQDNSINIFTTLTDKLTINEFMKYDIPCNNCLVQSMCINNQNNIKHVIINGGIDIILCEKLQKFIDGNRKLFNIVTFSNE